MIHDDSTVTFNCGFFLVSVLLLAASQS